MKILNFQRFFNLVRSGQVKLNLGCGLDKKPDFINVDLREEVQPDIVHDLEKKLPFPDCSVDEIIAKDVLEHFSFRKVRQILRDWFRVLKPGGKIYIQTPDLEAIARKVILSGQFNWEQMSYWVYGGQDYETNYHKAGFTIPELKKLLEEIGFVVDKIVNDGGTNICCWAHKPTSSQGGGQ